MHRQEMKYIYGKKINKSEPQSLVDQRKIIGNKLNFASREAYKLLRTNLIFSMCDEDKCKIIGITSALRGEGKSTTAINLAYSLAEANQKTLLIEADMRLPLVHRLLQLDKTVGLSNVLAGVAKLEDAVRHGILLYTLSVLPSGDIPPNPSELLSSSRMSSRRRRSSRKVRGVRGVFVHVSRHEPSASACNSIPSGRRSRPGVSCSFVKSQIKPS